MPMEIAVETPAPCKPNTHVIHLLPKLPRHQSKDQLAMCHGAVFVSVLRRGLPLIFHWAPTAKSPAASKAQSLCHADRMRVGAGHSGRLRAVRVD